MGLGSRARGGHWAGQSEGDDALVEPKHGAASVSRHCLAMPVDGEAVTFVFIK